MSITLARPRRFQSLSRQLISRYYGQIKRRSDAQHQHLCKFFAITFRPGDRTGSFLNQPLRPFGTPVAVCLEYGFNVDRGGRSMPIRGFRATMTSNGFVNYGGEGSVLFRHDAAAAPSKKSRRSPLNPQRNPALCQLALRMDLACERQAWRKRWLPRIPCLPKILLGFPVNQTPMFEDTPALRELAAEELDVPLNELGSNGEMLLNRYLRDLWDRQLMRPDDAANSTGTFLISAEYCTQAHRALRTYEDFTHLLGAPTFNPARRVKPLELPNPAAAIMDRFGVDRSQNFNQPISDEELLDIELAMRQAIGERTALTTEEVFDAITNADSPIIAWTSSLPKLRAVLDPAIAECVTDDDLLRAARRPDEPLIASGACRIQVLQRDANDMFALEFDSHDLNRRVDANFAAIWTRQT
jgi:hypothetical protein